MSFSPSGHVLGTPSGRQGSRTVVFLAVAQASLPLDHGIIHQTGDRGGRRTHKITRLSTSNPRSRAPTTTTAQRCPAGCRCPTSRHPVRTGGFEPPISWSPTARCQASLRSAASSSCGNRTRLAALKGRRPQTDRRTSHIGAGTFHAVGRAVLESTSPGFQPGAIPSQLPTQTKKA